MKYFVKLVDRAPALAIPLMVLAWTSLLNLETARAQYGPSVNAPTFHYDRQRTGWNSKEAWLTPSNVAGPNFGPLWNSPALDSVTINGTTYPPHLYATPLYIDSVQISTGTYAGRQFNVVFAATTNNFVYAINAFDSPGPPDVPAGTILWRTSLGTPAALPNADSPNGLDGGVALGVLGTPTIDLNRTPGTMYVVAQTTTDVANWRAFALDITSGSILPGWPLAITNSALAPINQNGPATYQPTSEMTPRGALNLSPDGKLLYVSFGSEPDDAAGWIIAVDTATPTLASAFAIAPSQVAYPNGGMWGSGGPAIDSAGVVYNVAGNSPSGSGSAPNVWGSSALSWAAGTPLKLRGTYTPWNYCQMDTNDTDIAGSPVVIPDLDAASTSTPHLLTFGNKQGNIYLIDRDNLRGGLTARPACSNDPSPDTSLFAPTPQSYYNGLPGPLNVFGPYSDTCTQDNYAKSRTTPAYFRRQDGANFVFYSGATKALACSQVPVPPGLVRLSIVTNPGQPAYLSIDAGDSALSLFSPGPPIITSNGSSNAIVWVLDANVYRSDLLVGSNVNHPVLYALDASTMQLLWKSTSSQLNVGGKYNHVVVARGAVFVGTDRIQAFGVPGPPPPPAITSVTFSPASVLGGNPSTGTATLNVSAPPGGLTLSLSSSNPSVASVPATVSVPDYAPFATFPVTTSPVSNSTPVTITASVNGSTQTGTLTVAPWLNSVTLNPTSVAGGSPSTGTVILSGPAPTGGITVNLSSGNSAATVPANVTVAANATTATFTVTTSVVASVTTGLISATYDGVTQSAMLTVNPPSPIAFVQGNSVNHSNSPSSSGAVTFASANRAGDLIVVSVAVLGTISGVSDSLGNTYSLATSTTSPANVVTAVYYAASIKAGTNTVTVRFAASSYNDVYVFEYGGLLTAAPMDRTATNKGTSTSASAGPVSTTSSNELIFAFAQDDSSTFSAGGPGFTVRSTASENCNEDSVVYAAGSYSASCTWKTSAGWALVLVTFKGSGGSGPPPPSVLSVSLNPASVTGGTPSTGTVTLTGAAPAGGATVGLSSSNTSAATVPANMTVAAGATTGTFTVTSLAVAATTSATITATSNGTASTSITVNPPSVTSVTLNPATVTGGAPSTGTITLNGPAPAGGASVTLASSNTAVATVPASATVPAGSTSTTFSITTFAVGVSTQLTLSATYNGSQNATLTVNPPPPAVSSLSLNPSEVLGGAGSTGTVTLSAAAPTGGAVVTLASSNTAAATVPASVTVPTGSISTTFTVTSKAVAATTGVTITASGSGSQTATLTVDPPSVSKVSLNPTSVVGGTNSTGTVTLNGPAPTGGMSVALSSSITTAATVSASVTVAAGATTATFTVTSLPQSTAASPVITGTLNGSATATLTVNPPTASSLALNPTSVVGGSPSTGTVTLTGPAPTGGISVTLSSNNTGVATVVASVTVAAGASSATFTVTTVAVASSTPVTITATLGATQTATLTVTPVAAIAFVQIVSVNHSNSPSSSSTAAFASANRAGDLIVVGVAVLGTVSSVTDTLGNTYTLAASTTSIANVFTGVYYAANVKAGTNTVTVRFAASSYSNVEALEYQGLSTSAPVDKTATGRGTSTTASAGPTATTVSANELIFAFAQDDGSNFSAAGSGFTLRSKVSQNCAEDRIVSVTGAYSASCTWTSSTGWGMVLVTFK